MTWNLDNSRSIYIQLIDEIKRRIIAGKYPPGSRMQSVRELADEAGVNPNTMQKALSELERDGLVYSQRTSGRFVTDDQERIRKMRHEKAISTVNQFIIQMSSLGYSREETLSLLSLATQKSQEKKQENITKTEKGGVTHEPVQ